MIAGDKAIEAAIDFQKNHPDTLLILTSDHETGGLEIKPGAYKKDNYVDVKWTTKPPIGHALHSSQLVPIYAVGPGAELTEKVEDDTQVFCLEKLGVEK
jgi:alkaline phosphatase